MNAEIVGGLQNSAIGALCGTGCALIWLPPVTRWDFARRFTFSLVAGIIFAPILRDFVGWHGWEGLVGAGWLSGLVAWPAAGILLDRFFTRLMRKWVARKLGITEDERQEDLKKFPDEG